MTRLPTHHKANGTRIVESFLGINNMKKYTAEVTITDEEGIETPYLVNGSSIDDLIEGLGKLERSLNRQVNIHDDF